MNDDIFPLVEEELAGQVMGNEVCELTHQYIEYKGLTVTVTNRNPLENKGFQGDFNRNRKRNRNRERIGESDE